MMTSHEVVQRVRVVAYLILGAAVALPIVENVGAILAAPAAGPAWRFGAIGSMSTMVSASLIGLLLIAVTSLLAHDRWMTILVSIVSVLLALAAVAGLAMFVLDAIQVRGRVQAGMRTRFDFAAVLALGRLVFIIVASTLLARVALRSSRTRTTSADADVLMVGRPRLDGVRR